MTWTTGSLTCISDLFTSVHTLGTLVYNFIQKIFIDCTEFYYGQFLGQVQGLTTVIHCQNTTSVDIKQIKCCKRIQSLIHNHMQQECSESAQEQRTAVYKSHQ